MAKKATRKTTRRKATSSSSPSRKRTSKKSRSAAKPAPAKKASKTAKRTGAKKAAKKTPGASKARARAKASGSKNGGARRGGRKTSRSNDALSLGHASEDLFASQIVDELDAHHGIDMSTIDIRVREGKATVRGLIADPDELEMIKDTLGEAGGISGMSVVVQVSSERREKDRDIARQVQDVIDAEPDLASQNIQVACVAKKVILRGTAESELAKVKAGLLALRAGPASAIRNRVVVTGGKKG